MHKYAETNASGALQHRRRQNEGSISGTAADFPPSETAGTETMIQRLIRTEALLYSTPVIGMFVVHITTFHLFYLCSFICQVLGHSFHDQLVVFYVHVN
jgi:hypothetical protein